jgi:hypothetical protein
MVKQPSHASVPFKMPQKSKILIYLFNLLVKKVLFPEMQSRLPALKTLPVMRYLHENLRVPSTVSSRTSSKFSLFIYLYSSEMAACTLAVRTDTGRRHKFSVLREPALNIAGMEAVFELRTQGLRTCVSDPGSLNPDPCCC